MRNNLIQGLEQINTDIIKMCELIELAIDRAFTAMCTHDFELAKSVIRYEARVNELEKIVEANCMQILISQQPVATDLRFVSVALKLVTDLERIAAQSSDISEIATKQVGKEFVSSPTFIITMAGKTMQMIRDATESFVNRDKELAEKVILADDEIDDMFIIVKSTLIDLINRDKQTGEQAIDFIMISKYLERIADHAVNIAEWVIFFITGEHKIDSKLAKVLKEIEENPEEEF